MIAFGVLIAKYGPLALKLLLSMPNLRTKFKATLAEEGQDVDPEVVSALNGNADAIKLLADELDEAIAFNKASQERLKERIRREGTIQ